MPYAIYWHSGAFDVIRLHATNYVSVHLAANISNIRYRYRSTIPTFFSVLVTVLGLSHMSEFVKLLPRTALQARKVVGHCRDNFTKINMFHA